MDGTVVEESRRTVSPVPEGYTERWNADVVEIDGRPYQKRTLVQRFVYDGQQRIITEHYAVDGQDTITTEQVVTADSIREDMNVGGEVAAAVFGQEWPSALGGIPIRFVNGRGVWQVDLNRPGPNWQFEWREGDVYEVSPLGDPEYLSTKVEQSRVDQAIGMMWLCRVQIMLFNFGFTKI